MVKSQACSALPLVPGLNVARLESARTIVSCTRSSARSAFLQSEIANLRSRGSAATSSFFISASFFFWTRPGFSRSKRMSFVPVLSQRLWIILEVLANDLDIDADVAIFGETHKLQLVQYVHGRVYGTETEPRLHCFGFSQALPADRTLG